MYRNMGKKGKEKEKQKEQSAKKKMYRNMGKKGKGLSSLYLFTEPWPWLPSIRKVG
jgi:hypothetical protein